jgi:hypothetical protein
MDQVVDAWRRVMAPGRSWVLFAQGTCVVFVGGGDDLAEQARTILREHGPVHPGTPSADFTVVHLEDVDGWAVTCHHPGVLTYVAPADVDESDPDDLLIGLTGRAKRNQDATDLTVIHVEE